MIKKQLIYGLLLLPVISAVLALKYHDFAYKSGVAVFGILIILILNSSKLRQNKDIWMVVGAFLFSIGGDWFLSNRHGELGIFIAGIALFFFAHVGYLLFALLNGKLNRTFTIVLQVCYLSFFFLKLFPAIEDKNLMIAVFIYLLISCFSLGAAAGIRTNPIVKWAYFFGIVMVLFSDTIIAFKEFAAYNVLNYLILPTYYLAQISITFALMRNSLSKGTNYNTTI
jgi:uncharacterized membrane protein YhhN